MREIGEEFVRLREDSRAGAWSALQRKLMSHFDVLVPYAVSMKDFLALSIDIEEFLKTEQGTESMHPMEALEHWLATPEPAPDSPIDDTSEPRGTIQ